MRFRFRWWMIPAGILAILLIVSIVILAMYGPLLKTLIPLQAEYPLKPSAVIDEATPHYFFYDDELLRQNQALMQKVTAPEGLRGACLALMAEADSLLEVGPFSVTDKPIIPPGGTVHDFYTLSPYFWPNRIIPGGQPYYYRDGIKNPEADSDRYDRVRLEQFTHAVQVLSLAFYFSGNEKYADRAALLLRTWFLEPRTRMSPHLANAQAMPGLADGWNWGMIRLGDFAGLTDAARLIQGSDVWKEYDHLALQQWYRGLLDWIAVHPFGQREYKKPNNHGTWFDASVSTIALFLGDEETARNIVQGSARLRIDPAIDPHGAQHQELVRSIPLHYSIYNLEALTKIARIGGLVGVDVWGYEGPEGQSIGLALKWMYEVLLEKRSAPSITKEVIEKDLNRRNRQKLLMILGAYQHWLEASDLPIPTWMEEFKVYLIQDLKSEGWEGVFMHRYEIESSDI